MTVRTLSATDLAIAIAVKAGTVRLVERPTRFGGTMVAVEDDVGLIEVHEDMAAATQRVRAVGARAGL